MVEDSTATDAIGRPPPAVITAIAGRVRVAPLAQIGAAAAAVLGGLAVVILIVRWMDPKKNSMALLPEIQRESRLHYGVEYDGDTPRLRIMWRFGR